MAAVAAGRLAALAGAWDAEVFALAGVASFLDVFHFANHAADFFAGTVAAAVAAAARVSQTVDGPGSEWSQQAHTGRNDEQFSREKHGISSVNV